MELIDIRKNLPNGENMGGIQQLIHFAYWEDILTFPTKPVAPATIEDASKLVGEIIMKPGKRFFSCYITDDTGEYKLESVGEVDAKSFVCHLSFFTPGLQSSILGFLNAVKNANMCFVATDAEGQQYIMGDAMRPAVYVGAPDGGGTGKETAARKGMSLEFTYKTGNIYIYPGSVPLTPAVSA